MTRERSRTLTLVALGAVIAALAAHLAGGLVRAAGVPLCSLGAVAALIAALFTPQRAAAAEAPAEKAESPLPQDASDEVTADVAVTDLSVLGVDYRRAELTKIEAVVDTILDACVALVRTKIDAFTVGVFFPTNDGGYRLRRYDSKSDLINPEAVIYPGVGVIGSFLKEGLKQLNLQEIVTDSMTLYYYVKDAGIRSLMASPIVAGGAKRGSFIVDSTEKKHFTDEDHAYLSAVASLCGQAVYYAYLFHEHRLEHARLSAMSSTEKYFFQNNTLDAVLDKVAEIVPFAFQCDRMTLSLREEEEPVTVVRRAWGLDAEEMLNMKAGIEDRTLVGLLYAKNMCIFRNFAADRYELRYSDDEPKRRELQSFLAFPIGVKECKGLILLESRRKNAFPESSRKLLSRLMTSAAIAIEKIQLLERTENLATHDGLTGLFNHRQFQMLLKESITRTLRYKDPLALVICDIDHFKKVNDSYGHRFGDTVLRAIAARLQQGIREGVDIAARYGGEEFALVLGKTDCKGALDIVERIRTEIAESVFQTPQGRDIHITMSFGIAIYGQHARNQEALIQKADKALYGAKENGRNRAELYYDLAATEKS